ncbi:hypothetical protein CERSUDRAFT_77630 [Gelatoporia subvermispora B]|uniref:Uncharacterized protein n=1 Tax=Ceriporiopsis subvermispora (strain B) TaxID=914234 RepID=M2Q5E6_CERS8|nr:hypothetical protein CERSUDRAFT_77630 [Gelatoporia subvermispora B]
MRNTPELGQALHGFVKTSLQNWLHDSEAWEYVQYVSMLGHVDNCAKISEWYRAGQSTVLDWNNGPDDGTVASLEAIFVKRAKEIVEEAAQSPDKFSAEERARIKVWEKKGYTPEDEEGEMVRVDEVKNEEVTGDLRSGQHILVSARVMTCYCSERRGNRAVSEHVESLLQVSLRCSAREKESKMNRDRRRKAT